MRSFVLATTFVAIMVQVAVAVSIIPSVHVTIPLSLGNSVHAASSATAIAAALKQGTNLTESSSGPIACAVCVNFVTRVVVNAYVEAVQYECEHAKTVKQVLDCRWIASHPAIFLGALVEQVKPVRDARFYCAGARYCGTEEQMTVAPTVSGSDDGTIAIQLESAASILADEVLRSSPLTVTSVTGAKYTGDGLITVDAENNVTCAQCLQFWFEAQIVAALNDIAAFCQAHSSNPDVAAKCEWISNHIPFVVGVLLARIQPIKFASGICIGAQYCGGNQVNRFNGTHY